MSLNIALMRIRSALPLTPPVVIDFAPSNILFSNLSVPENLATTSVIGTFFTVDSNGHAQNTFVYTIINDPDAKFSITDDGLILEAALDYETATSHSVTVRVTDVTGLTHDKTFTIDVLDFDEGEAAAAPINTVLPSISGTVQQDRTLTAVEGTWTGNGTPGYSYQWKNNTVAITGAIERTYTLVAGDVGDTITVTVTARNAAGTTSATSTATAAVSATAFVTSRFIRPFAFGQGDGTSMANAAALSSINLMISQAGANGIIYVRADEGSYTATLTTITAGGTSGNPCTIRGVTGSLAPMHAVFLGNRVSPYVAGGTVGPECFRLMGGANYLSWEFLEFQRCGDGCFRPGAPISGLTLESINAVNVQRFVQNTLISPSANATITGLTVRNVNVNGHSKDAFRIQYTSNDILFEDVNIDSERQDGDNFASGVIVTGTVNDATFRRVVCRNGLDTGLATDYWNADAFSSETGNDDLHYEACEGYGYSDSAFDLKSTNTDLTDCIAANNKWNYKIWNHNGVTANTLLRCKGIDPYLWGGTGGSVQLWTGHGPVEVTDSAFTDQRSVADHTREDSIEPGITTDVFRLQESDGSLTIVNTSVQRGPGTNLVTLEELGGTITGHDVAETPPTNSVLPVITGTAESGSTLSVSTGTWAGAGLSYSYQWLRDGLYIDTATASTYVLTAADVGAQISAHVYATDADGFVGEATSLQTAVTGVSTPVNTVAPSVSGLPVTGSTLTCDPGTWTGSPTFAYQWIRGASTSIGGATNPTYVVAVADEGSTLKCRVTATEGAASAQATSAATIVVAASGIETYFYIAPTAQGTGDGSTAADAFGSLDLSILGDRVANSPPAHHIRLLLRLVDGTPCEFIRTGLAVSIYSHGGSTVGPPTEDDPEGDRSKIYIEGWNAETEESAKAKITSDRTLWTLPADPETVTNTNGWTHGGSIFQIEDGVDNLVWRFLNFERVDTCFKYANGANCEGHEIDQVDFYNVRRLFDTGDGTGIGVTQVLSNFKISNILGIGHSKHAIRIRGASHTFKLMDCDIDSGRQSHDAFAVCYCLDFTAHDITMTRCIGRNCHDSESGPSGFWNGDAFTSEKNNYNVNRIECEAYGSADGGFDDKCTNLLMFDCISEDNKTNYKCWSTSATFNDCTGADPHSRGGLGGASHIQVAGAVPSLTFNGGTFEGGTYIFMSSETGVYGTATFNNVTFSGGSGFYSVNSNGYINGVTVCENCTGVPDNHAAATVPTYTASTFTGSNTSITRNLPANEDGDVAVAVIAGDTTTAPTVGSGWTYFGAAVVVGTFTARLAWKRLAGQTFERVSLTAGTGTHMRVCAVWIVAGCPLTGDPFSGYSSTSGTGTTLTSPTTVVSGDSRAVYRVFAKSTNLARSATPAGYTQRISSATNFGATGGVYVDSKENVDASTEAASVSTISASHPWISFGFAMKPLNATISLAAPVYSQDVAISGATTPGATLTRVPGVVSGNPGPTQTWVWQKLTGSGGSNAPVFTDGGTSPHGDTATGPSSAYDSTTNKTWYTWEATIGTNSIRWAKVRVLNHTTGTWSSIYTIGRGISEDDHGQPAIVIDHQGYVHCFYGCHGNPIRHSRTTVAGDPSAWTLMPPIGDVLTYPHPMKVGNTIYLFARFTVVPGIWTHPWVLYKSTAVNNGSITWAAKVTLFDFGFDARFYQGHMEVRGTKVYLNFTQADAANTGPSRRNGYMAYYETTDGSVHNVFNTYSESAAQLPVLLSTANNRAAYSVFLFDPPITQDEQNHTSFIFDASDVMHIFYHHTGTAWFRRTLINGVLGTVETLPSDFRYPTLYLDASNRIVATWQQGGGIHKKVRETNGTWGATTTLHTWTHAYGSGNLQKTYPSGPDARVIWCERDLPAEQANGQLKGWLYGDSGFPGGTGTAWVTVQVNGATYSATVSGAQVRIVETATNTEGSDTSTSATKVIV